MLYSVDRIEGELAVLVDDQENTVCVRIEMLPNEIKAGEMVRLENEQYVLAADATQVRRAQIRQLQQRLRRG